MKLCFLLVPVIVASYTIGISHPDSVLDQTVGVTATDCRFQSSENTAFVCRRCGGSTAYSLTTPRSFSVQGMLRSIRDKLAQIVTEAQRVLPPANITFSTVNDRFCLYLDGFAADPDYAAAIAAFTSYRNAPLQLLENFAITSVSAQYIGLEARQGSGSGFYFRYMENRYTVSQARRVSPTMTLSLDGFTARFEYAGAFVTYTGIAVFDGATGTIPFSVLVPYDRPAYADYTLHLAVRSQYRLGALSDIIAPAASCSSQLSVPGLADMQQLPVLMSDILFSQDSANRMNFYDVVLYYFIPPFAIAPYIYLDQPTGSLRIQTVLATCTVYIDSTWRRNNVPTLSFHIGQSLNSTLTAFAYMATSPRATTIGEIAQDFYTSMYPDPFNLFPIYTGSAINIADDVSGIRVSEPRFQFAFTPETVISVTGTASYLRDQDMTVAISMGRVNGALESFVQVEVTSAEILSWLTGAQVVPLQGFRLSVNRVLSSSVALSLTQTSYLRPGNVRVRTTTAGFQTELELELDDQCSRSEYCQLLLSVLPSPNVTLSGRFMPDFFLVSTAVPNITLAGSLLFTDRIFRIYFGPPRVATWTEGLFNIQGDSRTLLSFRGNLTDSNGDARLSGIMRGQWINALDLSRLTVQGLLLTADVDGSGNVVDSTIRGIGTFGECDANCWYGDATLSLNLQSYLENYIVLDMRPVDSVILYNQLMAISNPPRLLRMISYPSDLTISYAYRRQNTVAQGLTITGQVSVFGLPAVLTSNFQNVSQSEIDLFFQSPFFTLGSTNVQVAGSYNSAVSGRITYFPVNNTDSGIIIGTVTLWGISLVEDVQITDSSVSFVVSGNPFSGTYAMDLQVTGPLSSNISNSTLTVSGSVDSDSVSTLQTLIAQSLARWVQQGVDTLERIQDLMNQQLSSISSYSSQLCTEACPLVQECVGEPQFTCTQNPILETCVSTKQGCSNLVVSCDSTLTTCMQTQATCAAYDNQVLGGGCVQWDTTCVSSIDTCQNWSQECTETVEQGCGLIEDSVVNDTCLRQEMLCEERTLVDSTCQMRCNNVQRLLNEAQTTYNAYERTYTNSSASFGAMRELTEPGTVLFTVRPI